MKIVISQQGVKREIEGPFEMCILDRKSLEALFLILHSKFNDENWHGGWFVVHEKVDTACNTPPRPWKE